MSESQRPSAAVLIAGAPLAGYAFSYAYEVGYAGHFGVPFDMISVDVTRFFVALTALVGIMLLVMAGSAAVGALLRASPWPTPVNDRLGNLAQPAIMLIFLSYLSGGVTGSLVIGAVVMTVFFGLFDFLGPMLTQRATAGYVAKLEAEDKRTERSFSFLKPLVTLVLQKSWRTWVLVVFVSVFAILGAFVTGRSAAVRQVVFDCPADTSAVVFVRSYGAMVIGARYNRAARRLAGELVIGTRGQGQWATLRRKWIGQLKRAEL